MNDVLSAVPHYVTRCSHPRGSGRLRADDGLITMVWGPHGCSPRRTSPSPTFGGAVGILRALWVNSLGVLPGLAELRSAECSGWRLTVGSWG